MEPPQIRLHRFEQAIAVKWADDEHWYRIDPDRLIHGTDGDRFRLAPGALADTPDGEWLDPLDDPRPDIRRWTEPIRADLRAVLRMLDDAETHPWSG